MDPNEALRIFVAFYFAEQPLDDLDEEEQAKQQAIEAAHDLLVWLANGGFPPDWTPLLTKNQKFLAWQQQYIKDARSQRGSVEQGKE